MVYSAKFDSRDPVNPLDKPLTPLGNPSLSIDDIRQSHETHHSINVTLSPY
ncbi:MAG: hypothetical protein FWH37_07900 [Candidatus Bathyarchaeota archaeon]|nr:hypothetical protein [Candidatus Termiticorpusculum sp.]